jgi:hypothetical protein
MPASVSNRIPDEMLADVLAEATRLHAEATAGYSFEDLQQACAEINIPPEIIKKAIANVEAQRMKHRLQWQRTLAFLKQQFFKGIPLGAAIFLGATPIVGFLKFYTSPEQEESSNPLTTMTVKVGELKYLKDPQDLSIAVRTIGSTREFGGISLGNSRGITGVIAVDGYQSIPLDQEKCEKKRDDIQQCSSEPAQVGQSYIYQGLYQYQIKIISIDRDQKHVVFQVDRNNDKPTSPIKALEQKLKTLKTDSDDSQQALQKKISALESKNDASEQREIYHGERIKALERENQILKDLKSN